MRSDPQDQAPAYETLSDKYVSRKILLRVPGKETEKFIMLTAPESRARMTRLGIEGADLAVNFVTDGGQQRYMPALFNIGSGGMFLAWPSPPPGLTVGKEVRIVWTSPPFIHMSLEARGEIVAVSSDGVHIQFVEESLPEAVRDDLIRWLSDVDAAAMLKKDDVVKTSKYYMRATLWSAGGLAIGGFSLLSQPWLGSEIAWIGLSFMIITIVLFGVYRWYAGRSEQRAIEKGYL